VVFRVGIEEPPYHSLISRVVLSRLVLEEVNAPLAQCDRDLDPLVPEDQIFRRRKEVANDFQLSDRFISISDSHAHKLPYPFAVGLD
jgi:hypothetical protein